jgi:hypothetical protein
MEMLRPVSRPTSGRPHLALALSVVALLVLSVGGLWLALRPRGLDLGGSVRSGSPVWRSDGWIYFIGSASDDSEATGSLWRVREGEAGRPVDTGDIDCPTGWDLVDLFAIGARELGLGIACQGEAAVRYYRLDPVNQARAMLSESVAGAVSATWNPTGSVGFATTWTAGRLGGPRGERCRTGLTRLSPQGLECVLTNPSRGPVFAESGDRVYFLGSPCPTGTDGMGPAGATWSVCVWDLGSGGVRAIGATFASPIDMTVDPALTRAAVTDESGVWLVGLSDGRTNRVGEGTFGRATFSPDGRRLAVPVWARGFLGHRTELRVIPIP